MTDDDGRRFFLFIPSRSKKNGMKSFLLFALIRKQIEHYYRGQCSRRHSQILLFFLNFISVSFFLSFAPSLLSLFLSLSHRRSRGRELWLFEERKPRGGDDAADDDDDDSWGGRWARGGRERKSGRWAMMDEKWAGRSMERRFQTLFMGLGCEKEMSLFFIVLSFSWLY